MALFAVWGFLWSVSGLSSTAPFAPFVPFNSVLYLSSDYSLCLPLYTAIFFVDGFHYSRLVKHPPTQDDRGIGTENVLTQVWRRASPLSYPFFFDFVTCLQGRSLRRERINRRFVMNFLHHYAHIIFHIHMNHSTERRPSLSLRACFYFFPVRSRSLW